MRLDEATVTNLLADFIRDRADSNDYRKHLGLLALVRQDFERLSNLMDEQNFYLVPPTSFDNQSAYDASKNFKLLKTKKKKKKNKSIESFCILTIWIVVRLLFPVKTFVIKKDAFNDKLTEVP